MNNQSMPAKLQPLQQMISEATRREPNGGPASKMPIINEVPDGMLVEADTRTLLTVIRELFSTIRHFGEGADVRVSAKEYGNVTLLHFKNHGRLNSPQFATSLVPVQQLAESLTGSVSVTSFRNDVTTVAFSFVNRSPALN